MQDRLSNLISIFDDRNLDFSKNRADGDDILGDAYEYLMRHFATESGKSKGQFYTPAEVSRIMAKVIGIAEAKRASMTTFFSLSLFHVLGRTFVLSPPHVLPWKVVCAPIYFFLARVSVFLELYLSCAFSRLWLHARRVWGYEVRASHLPKRFRD